MIQNEGMLPREAFARVAGTAVGAAAGLVMPHLFCVAPFLAGAVGMGLDSGWATLAGYVVGIGIAVVGSALAATYGVPICRKPSCQLFGETRAIRLRKAALMVGPGLGLAFVANTIFKVDADAVLAKTQEALTQGQAFLDICGQIVMSGGPV